ncbi:MAG TPA: carboxypeptidase-like regulatory domain-containing protein, partial [Puia sp.]|nr:carboxypeptidase-like regulatory domain-containing protein [Puia sp.]
KNDVEVPAGQPVAASTTPAAGAVDSKTADSTSMVAANDKATTLYKKAPKKDAEKEVDKAKERNISKKDIVASYNYSPAPAAPYTNNNTLSNGITSNYVNTQPSFSLFDTTKTFRRDSLSFMLRGATARLTTQNESDRDMAFFKKSVPDQLVFTGKVLNTQNIPLAGATVSFKKGREYVNTVTDANGYFTLTVPKKDTISRVVVNYVGYEQNYMTLNTDDKTGNVVLLKPQSSSLNEVVVVGYGAKRRELTRSDINSVPKPLSETAVPAEGWPAYNIYLQANKSLYPVDTTIRGFESISFIVNKKGELSSFRVERSLSPAHDSLAIRLVRQGPSWKLLKGKKEKARVVLTW